MAYIFLDESGTHKDEGSTVLALVFVVSDDLNTLNQGILQAEKELGISNFHWKDHAWAVKKKFLKLVINLPFTWKISVFRNPFSWGNYEKALKYSNVDKGLNTLVMDGKKPRVFRKEYKKILRSRGVILRKLILGNDRAYSALRLADCVAGLMRAHTDDPDRKQVKEMHDLIFEKIIFFFCE